MKFYLFIWFMCGFLPSIVLVLMSMVRINFVMLAKIVLHTIMGPIFPVLFMVVVSANGLLPPDDDTKDDKK